MNKNYIYKRRLLKLADFLSTLPRNRFDFRTYVGNDWGGKQDLSCGTTACAFGWATTIPSLHKAGLRLVKNNDGGFYKFIVGLKTKSCVRQDPPLAGLKVFDLNGWEFDRLFVPQDQGGKLSGSSTPKQVAAHIRKFVAQKYK